MSYLHPVAKNWDQKQRQAARRRAYVATKVSTPDSSSEHALYCSAQKKYFKLEKEYRIASCGPHDETYLKKKNALIAFLKSPEGAPFRDAHPLLL